MIVGFWWLLIWGLLLVGIGMAFLIVAIPWAASEWPDSDAKTEFYSVGASRWCVAVGLFLIVLAGLGAATVRTVMLIRGR